MPRARYTLEDLRKRLKERAGDTPTFWKPQEIKDALNEAISVWQALAGEWTTRIAIPAESDSPSFYPVAKQIVSLTRVGIDSVASSAPELVLRIGPNSVFRNPRVGPNVYHTAMGREVQWNAITVGGPQPFTYLWTFPVEFTLEPLSTVLERDPKGRYTEEGIFTTSCQVTDAAGRTATSTFDVTVLNPRLFLSYSVPPPL